MMTYRFLPCKAILLAFIVLGSVSCLKAPQYDVLVRQAELTVNENDGSFNVEFYLPGGARHQNVEISYRIGGSAKKGRDYNTEGTGSIVIPGGLVSASFKIDLIDNIYQDGDRTIEVGIIIVIQNGNNIFQGTAGQTMVITIKDDDCSIYLAGTWEYVANYYMISNNDTIAVGQNNMELGEGVSPDFTGEVIIEDTDGKRNYFISDMMIGMFSELDIETPCPLNDECGIISGPNDGSILLMGTLPAYFNASIREDSSMLVKFEYSDGLVTAGGGSAVMMKK